ADDDGQVTGAGGLETVQRLRDQLHVRSRQDRQPHTVNVLSHGRGDDLLRSQPDALIDDLETGIARPNRDLLGAVAVPVKAGFADQQSQSGPDLLARGADALAHLRQLVSHGSWADSNRAGNPCGRTVLAKNVAQRLGPRARGNTGWCSLQ